MNDNCQEYDCTLEQKFEFICLPSLSNLPRETFLLLDLCSNGIYSFYIYIYRLEGIYIVSIQALLEKVSVGVV